MLVTVPFWGVIGDLSKGVSVVAFIARGTKCDEFCSLSDCKKADNIEWMSNNDFQ